MFPICETGVVRDPILQCFQMNHMRRLGAENHSKMISDSFHHPQTRRSFCPHFRDEETEGNQESQSNSHKPRLGSGIRPCRRHSVTWGAALMQSQEATPGHPLTNLRTSATAATGATESPPPGAFSALPPRVSWSQHLLCSNQTQEMGANQMSRPWGQDA